MSTNLLRHPVKQALQGYLRLDTKPAFQTGAKDALKVSH